jgi:hypothetical protein
MLAKTWKHTALNPHVVRVAEDASRELTDKGIAHALIGGLAVGAYGWARATADVDFLVSSEAASLLSGRLLGGEVEGVTYNVGSVDVDLVLPQHGEGFLDEALSRAEIVEGVPLVPIEAFVYLKLKSGRERDQADVVEMLKQASFPVEKVRGYLVKHLLSRVEDFDSLLAQARLEKR